MAAGSVAIAEKTDFWNPSNDQIYEGSTPEDPYIHFKHTIVPRIINTHFDFNKKEHYSFDQHYGYKVSETATITTLIENDFSFYQESIYSDELENNSWGKNGYGYSIGFYGHYSNTWNFSFAKHYNNQKEREADEEKFGITLDRGTREEEENRSFLSRNSLSVTVTSRYWIPQGAGSLPLSSFPEEFRHMIVFWENGAGALYDYERIETYYNYDK